MQFKNYLVSAARWLAAIALLIGLQTRFNPVLPLAAQGPGIEIAGTPVSPISTHVVNFSQAARSEAASPRARQTPIAIQSPVHSLEKFSASRNNGAQAPSRAPQAQLRVASPLPSASFQALPDATPLLNIIPPDTMGAVGVDHLMTTLNSQVRIQDKSGAIISTVSLSSFWGGASVFDPHIVFDPFNQRWIFVVAANAESADSAVCVAVSQTNLPTGFWSGFCYSADATHTLWADFPQVGFNKDWIVVSVSMFPIVSGVGTAHGQVYAINKASLYASVSDAYAWNTGTAYPIAPAVTYDNSLATENLVEDYSYVPGQIRKSKITGSPPSVPTMTLGTAIATSVRGSWFFADADVLPQLGGAQLIEMIDTRILNVVVRTVNGVTSTWCAQNIWLPASAPTHGVVQWWELDGNPSSPAVFQQGRIEDATATTTNGGYHFAYPSLAVNKDGDMLIGFSLFSSALYASGAYAFRFAGDAASTTRDPVVLKAGEGYYFKTFGYGRNRWGDFSHTVVDPMGDVNFWTIQEYAATPLGTYDGGGIWGTWWGKVQLTVSVPSILYFPEISHNP